MSGAGRFRVVLPKGGRRTEDFVAVFNEARDRVVRWSPASEGGGTEFDTEKEATRAAQRGTSGGWKVAQDGGSDGR
jgi:hypothetical protein